jgi:hypothetical protein
LNHYNSVFHSKDIHISIIPITTFRSFSTKWSMLKHDFKWLQIFRIDNRHDPWEAWASIILNNVILIMLCKFPQSIFHYFYCWIKLWRKLTNAVSMLQQYFQLKIIGLTIVNYHSMLILLPKYHYQSYFHLQSRIFSIRQ